MIFSKQELICFNSVLDGSNIFGVQISAPLIAGEDYVSGTLESLKEKEYLDGDGKPTPMFFMAVRMLDQYKKAKKHLFINQSRIAFTDDDHLILLSEVEEGFQFIKMHKLLYLQSLVLSTPFLKKKDNGVENSKTVEPKDFAKTFEENDVIEMNFCIEKFEDKKINGAVIMCNIGENGYLYDLSTKQRTTCGPTKLRKTLAGFFGVTGPVKAGKSREES